MGYRRKPDPKAKCPMPGTFPTRLCYLMAKYGISFKELGSELHLHYTTLVKYCSGDNSPSLDNALAIADFFGVSIEFMCGRTNKEV